MDDFEKHIIFHVGTVKTASTYLQKFLLENKKQLSSLDVDYILFSTPRLDLPRYANADLILDDDFDVQHLKKLIRASPCRHIIISEEGLMGRPESIKSEAFAAYSRIAIMYVRPPVDLVASWAGENSLPYNFKDLPGTEDQGVVAVTEGIKRFRRTYGRTINSFLNTIESDETLKLVIRPYDRSQLINGDIICDFFHAIGLSNKIDGIREILKAYDLNVVNEGRSRKYCDVSAKAARLVKKYGLEEIYSEAFVDFVLERCASGDDRKVIETLSDAEMETTVEILEPYYERLCLKGYKGTANIQGMLPDIYGNGRRAYQPVDDEEIKRAVIEFLESSGRAVPPDLITLEAVHNIPSGASRITPLRSHSRISREKMPNLNEMTLEELREDVQHKTFAVQSLIGQRQRLLRLMELLANAGGLAVEQIQNIMKSVPESHSQFKQEVFSLAMAKGKRNGYFVEFGACDGLHLSNTSILEKMFGWRGILAEPARAWHAELKANRSAIIDLRCVFSESGKTVDFNETKQPGESSVSTATNKPGEKYPVTTVSLMDLLREHRAPREIDFLSIDTEGTEFEVLNAFDFDKYKFGFISVEQHRQDGPLTRLLESVGYKVLYSREPNVTNFSQVTGFDLWYIPT